MGANEIADLTLAALVLAAIAIVVVSFVVAQRLFGAQQADSFKNALEATKVVGLLLVAGFTFFFIDRQRQELSQADYDFKVYQAFFEASNAKDVDVKVYVLNNITTYRQNFLIKGSRLDNTLVALSKTLLDDRGVQAALAAPPNEPIVTELSSDRSPILTRSVKTLEEVLGPLISLTDDQRANWEKSNLIAAPLPFPIRKGYGEGEVNSVRVHRRAAPFFETAFGDVRRAGLQSAIRTFDGAYSYVSRHGRTRLSSHAYGVAIDLNAATNPIGTPGDMDPRIVQLFKQNGFIWGGDWSGKGRDPMHFEVLADLLVGSVPAGEADQK